MGYGNGAINPRAQVRNAGNQNLLFYLWCCATNLMQSPRVELIYVWLSIVMDVRVVLGAVYLINCHNVCAL